MVVLEGHGNESAASERALVCDRQMHPGWDLLARNRQYGLVLRRQLVLADRF
jgi:hypothetical protein